MKKATRQLNIYLGPGETLRVIVSAKLERAMRKAAKRSGYVHERGGGANLSCWVRCKVWEISKICVTEGPRRECVGKVAKAARCATCGQGFSRDEWVRRQLRKAVGWGESEER